MLNTDWPKELLESLLKADETVDVHTWFPYRDSCLTPYYYTEFARRFYYARNAIRAASLPLHQVIAQLRHVTHFRDELDNLLAYWSHGDLQISRTELSTVCRFIVEILAVACWDDVFSRNGHLLLIPPPAVRELEASFRWTNSTTALAREVGKLVVSLNTLAYSLYTDVWANAAGDISHGPYSLSDGRRLIIRDYVDLAPTELWSHCAGWDVRAVRILSCYKQDVDLSIDFYGSLNSKSNLIQGLSRFAIEVDGQQLNAETLGDVINHVANRAIEQNKLLRSLGFEALKRKFLEAHCYTERDILKVPGLDWRPTQSMYNAVAGKPLLPGAEDWGDDCELYTKALDAVIAP